MSQHLIKCCTCGKEYTIGMYPFCPHGKIDISADPRRYYSFENYIDTNIAEQPTEITSPGQRRRLMKQNALEERPREHINDLNHRRAKLGLPPLPR